MRGFVSLVGAGCGTGLITLLGAERLKSCDAVVYDDLIAPDTLRLAPRDAQLVYMGKRAGRTSAKQEEICAELIRLAREGKRVVRLKGGDPYVFGRGGEEMQALIAAGVACEEIPGVSSAYAVPAMAGIPVTHRGVSRGFHVVTAHTAGDGGLPDYFDGLARLPGTLVILMGLGKLDIIAARLIELGRDPATPAAVVSDSSRGRYCVRGTLADIAGRAAGALPPAVIVIGETAGMDLSPVESLPLRGMRVGLTGTARMNARLARELARLGAEPFTACELELRPLPEADVTPTDCPCLVFTSAAGVELYFERLLASGRDARDLAGVQVAAIGRATAAALAGRGVRAGIVPEGQNSAALARLLEDVLPVGSEICIYRSAQGDRALAERLGACFPVRDIHAYTAEPGGYTAPRELVESAAAFTFTSAAGARAALDRLSPLPCGAVLAAIGEPTSCALAGLPNRVIIAPSPDAASLAEALINIHNN